MNVSDPAPTVGAAAQRRRFPRAWVIVFCALGILLLFCVALGPINNGLKQARANAQMQQGRQIGQCMLSYATDHYGNYPDGKSSTEIFQKLLDENYVTDPGIFYLPLSGKIQPVAGQKLKPENVCYDVTSGVDSNSSDLLPLVFITGYKVMYAPGGAAVPLVKPCPLGIAIFYKGNNAIFLRSATVENPDGSIPNFIPSDFDPKGKTYRQLTPDGPLP
jgi:hypothetical protein